jgi:ectoine hydroxylase-related dioxygenase (phytanoyl-CoA dioxygenase family)
VLGQLPDLTEPYEVPQARIQELRQKGHTVLRGVLSPDEVAAWAPVIREVGLGLDPVNRTSHDQDALLADAFLQLQNLWCADERTRRFSLAARFGQIAADLLGVDAVRMYHDQAIFKEPGGGPTPFHQDQYYFPLDGDEIITMWLPLTDVTPEMGSLMYGTGTHRLGHLGEFEASEESERVFRKLIADKGIPLETHGAMAAGDATFHTAWTLHGAPENTTANMREVMTIIWFADGLRGIEPQHEWHQKDYDKWMPDVKPGEPAAGRLNPLVWRRP